MRPDTEIKVPNSICGGSDDWQGLNRALAAIQNFLKALANGEGTILRCHFTAALRHGGSTSAEIHRFDGDGFTQIRDGVVHDEDNIWVAVSGDYGWVTARDNELDSYSLLLVTGNDQNGTGTGGLLERLIQAILQKATDGDSSGLTLLTQLITQILANINSTIISNLLQYLITTYGYTYLPPGGLWILKGTLSGTLSQGSSATMSVTGSSPAQNVTVYDYLLGGGQTVTSGSKVVVAWDVVNKRYMVIDAGC